MDAIAFDGKSYEIDRQGFLEKSEDWDESFAEGTAPFVGIRGGLTEQHWEVIRFIRNQFKETGDCPLVYSTCRAFGLRLREMEALFPAGYLRGACRLAGITYRDRFVDFFGGLPHRVRGEEPLSEKAYRVDVFGFLIDPSDWDESYAENKAREMKVPGGLSEKHLQILRQLRERFQETGVVPTVIECCKENGIELDALEALFPDGYHRGAVKLAGLCVRPERRG
jgi:tRNA 2-thiouridine synthesizing protein E